MSYFRRVLSSCFGLTSEERRPLLGGTTAPTTSQNKIFVFASDGPILAFNFAQKGDEYEAKIMFAKKRGAPESSYDINSDEALYYNDTLKIGFKNSSGNLTMNYPLGKSIESFGGDPFFLHVIKTIQSYEPGYFFNSTKGLMLGLMNKKENKKQLSFFNLKEGREVLKICEGEII
jgi:hypothetical protein